MKIFINKTFLVSFFIVFGIIFSNGVSATIQTNITISAERIEKNQPVEIKIEAKDSINSILYIDLYVDENSGSVASHDCTNEGSPVNECNFTISKSFSTEKNYTIFGKISDLNDTRPETHKIILTVVADITIPPDESPDGPVIGALNPNPAPVNSTVDIYGINFCPGLTSFDSSVITVIFDQSSAPGGEKFLVTPFQITSSCDLLKVNVPPSLIPEYGVKVSVKNTKWTSPPVDLALDIPLDQDSTQKKPTGSGRLGLNWPDSPVGTPLNGESKLPDLIKYLYEWGIVLGGLAVFISLIIAGIQYLSSFGNPTSMKDAMDKIKSAFFGLILLLSSWLILNTINPDLTTFRPLVMPLPGELFGACETNENCVELFGENYECDVNKFCAINLKSKLELIQCKSVTIEGKTVKEGGYMPIDIAAGEPFSYLAFPNDVDKNCLGYLEFYPRTAGGVFGGCAGDGQRIVIKGGNHEDKAGQTTIKCMELKKIE